MRDLRECLFADALKLNLAVGGDVLVARKKSIVGKSVKDKHVEDIWTLVGVIQRREAVPRVLLKNGKRRKEEFILSQTKQREKEISGDVGRLESRRSCDDTGSSSVRSCDESRRSCDCVSGGSVLVCAWGEQGDWLLWARK